MFVFKTMAPLTTTLFIMYIYA